MILSLPTGPLPLPLHTWDLQKAAEGGWGSHIPYWGLIYHPRAALAAYSVPFSFHFSAEFTLFSAPFLVLQHTHFLLLEMNASFRFFFLISLIFQLLFVHSNATLYSFLHNRASFLKHPFNPEYLFHNRSALHLFGPWHFSLPATLLRIWGCIKTLLNMKSLNNR